VENFEIAQFFYASRIHCTGEVLPADEGASLLPNAETAWRSSPQMKSLLARVRTMIPSVPLNRECYGGEMDRTRPSAGRERVLVAMPRMEPTFHNDLARRYCGSGGHPVPDLLRSLDM
jgi:hypothetical protein